VNAILYYFITDAEVEDHALLRKGLADVASRGFDGIHVDFRNVRSGHEGARLHAALRIVCREAKALGLGVIVEASYSRLAAQMKTEAPELFTDTWQPYRIRLREGHFTIESGDEVQHVTLERCWALGTDRRGRIRRCRDVTAGVRRVAALVEGGGCAQTEHKEMATARITCRVNGMRHGELLVVMRRRHQYQEVDLSQPGLRRYVARRLAFFRDLRLTGLAWDEPHFDFHAPWKGGRTISAHLEKRFRERFGYALADRMPDLWFDRTGHRAALTRLHYAELLEQSLADLEADFKKKAVRRLKQGNRALMGIHRTMHEETGDDFLIGCCDYFRHNRHTLGAFTDSVFEREDSMVGMLHLTRSMALAGGGPAWNNSWGFRPAEAHHAYYLRLMGAMQIRWLGHAYHSSHQFGPGYPDHPLWDTLRQHLSAHRGMLAALDGAKPSTDTAVLYNWQAMATFAGNYLHVHRRNLLLLAKRLTAAQVQFRFVDCDALQGDGAWRQVIVPWPDMLPAGLLARLADLAANGTEVLLFGPPAFTDADGRSQSAAFARLCGISPLSPADERAMAAGIRLSGSSALWTLDPEALEANYRSNERASYPDHFKAYALRPLSGTEVLAHFNRQAVAVRRGRVTYVAAEAAHFPGLIESLPGTVPAVKASPGWALFAYRRGAEQLLAGVSHGGRPRRVVLGGAWRGFATDPCSSFVAACEGGRVRAILRETAQLGLNRPT